MRYRTRRGLMKQKSNSDGEIEKEDKRLKNQSEVEDKVA